MYICNSFTNFLHVEEALPAYDVIKDHSKVDEFTAELIVRGYSDDDILAVLGGNFTRVFTEILG